MSSRGIPVQENLTAAVISPTEVIPLFSCPVQRVREVDQILFTYTGTVAGLTIQLQINDGALVTKIGLPVAGITSGAPIDLSPSSPVYYGESSQLEIALAGATATDAWATEIAGVESTP